MTFPTSNISADNIRAQLAANNTAGAQTPVTLDDTAVRAAADKLSGTVSYGDLSGKNVLYSGLVTFDSRVIQTGPRSQINIHGYYIYLPSYYGGVVGSLNTTTYYREADAAAGGTAQLASFTYDVSTGAPAGTYIGFSSPVNPSPYSVSTLNVYLNNTKYVFNATAFDAATWYYYQDDVFNLLNKVGQTYQVVITY
jgi:hypothetical protein